jgi:hypothetical protein
MPTRTDPKFGAVRTRRPQVPLAGRRCPARLHCTRALRNRSQEELQVLEADEADEAEESKDNSQEAEEAEESEDNLLA